eukprot:6213638-Pleurochrysis_carterae.AAC.4
MGSTPTHWMWCEHVTHREGVLLLKEVSSGLALQPEDARAVDGACAVHLQSRGKCVREEMLADKPLLHTCPAEH